jgi:hypothetical protein
LGTIKALAEALTEFLKIAGRFLDWRMQQAKAEGDAVTGLEDEPKPKGSV